MKKIKCIFYMGLGIGAFVLYKTYEEEIMCACKKIKKLEKNMIENGLDIN